MYEELVQTHGSIRKAASMLNIPESTLRGRLRKEREQSENKSENSLKSSVLQALKNPITLVDLCNKVDASPKKVEEILSTIVDEKYNLIRDGETMSVSNKLKEGGLKKIKLEKFDNETYKFGFCGDNHLGSKHARLDVLHALYERFKEEGVTTVYNTGNWIDGEAPRINFHELTVRGLTNQIDYFVQNYPKVEGITTYFVAGDDHEGWYVQREGIDIGSYAELAARKAGRTDLVYLGYVEADVEYEAPEGSAHIKVMHPGGGSAYALSYSPQKMIESFSGGEKPSILLLGHYHKFDYIYYRNVHCIQTGTTQDQTVFMRKKKLQAHVGGGIVEFQMSKKGVVNRLKVEWMPFLDKEYYERESYY